MILFYVSDSYFLKTLHLVLSLALAIVWCVRSQMGRAN